MIAPDSDRVEPAFPMSPGLPRSAYIHVPFCRHRCGYCNFSVVADRDDLMDRYLNAIDRELSIQQAEMPGPPPLDTIFIGGGTPTHFDLDRLDQFLSLIRRRFDLNDESEWTMEANPEDISDQKLELMAAHGVNRVSLGVQSFNDSKLKTLERSHRGETAAEVVHQVAAVIPNVSLDLIFAAPEETVEDWNRDLKIAMGLPVRHLSTYALTFEKGTAFWTRRQRGALNDADESDELQMYDDARDVLASAGLEHYEISSFARPSARCRHNMAYWRGDGWYAAGPGAAAFVDGQRTLNHRSTTTYLKRMEDNQSPVAETETIDSEQAAREKAGFGVRMIDGVDLDEIRQATGIDLQSLCATELSQLEQQSMIRRSGGHIQLTTQGIHFADTVAAEFFS